MLDVSIVNETSPEANWNRQAGGQADKPVYWEAAPPKNYFSVTESRIYLKPGCKFKFTHCLEIYLK